MKAEEEDAVPSSLPLQRAVDGGGGSERKKKVGSEARKARGKQARVRTHEAEASAASAG